MLQQTMGRHYPLSTDEETEDTPEGRQRKAQEHATSTQLEVNTGLPVFKSTLSPPPLRCLQELSVVDRIPRWPHDL